MAGGFTTEGHELLRLHHPEDWPDLLTAPQVADLLAVDRKTILNRINDRTLSATRIGTVWRIPAEAVWPLVPREIRDQWPQGRWNADTELADQ